VHAKVEVTGSGADLLSLSTGSYEQRLRSWQLSIFNECERVVGELRGGGN
jgi:hypothetical protein